MVPDRAKTDHASFSSPICDPACPSRALPRRAGRSPVSDGTSGRRDAAGSSSRKRDTVRGPGSGLSGRDAVDIQRSLVDEFGVPRFRGRHTDLGAWPRVWPGVPQSVWPRRSHVCPGRSSADPFRLSACRSVDGSPPPVRSPVMPVSRRTVSPVENIAMVMTLADRYAKIPVSSAWSGMLVVRSFVDALRSQQVVDRH
jgi:hypothetical protein